VAFYLVVERHKKIKPIMLFLNLWSSRLLVHRLSKLKCTMHSESAATLYVFILLFKNIFLLTWQLSVVPFGFPRRESH
jgi:hypothetical protein